MVLTSVFLCTTFTAFWGESPFSARMAPKGNCSECCPIKHLEDIAFHLYTRGNPVKPERLYIDDVNRLHSSNFQFDKPVVFYVHGFTEQGNGRASTTIKNAYLKKGWFNVIVVDWSSLCAFPWYAHAVINTREVGFYLSEMIHFLRIQGVPIQNIHLIGFSLGAEIVGFSGKDTTYGRLPRITGLDPAFPLYMFAGKKGHLADTDAEFVDVIHTDGGIFGFPIALGDADFFPNGGFPAQPGCQINHLLQRSQIARMVSCSHDRAWQYYAESVLNEKGFPATRCASYQDYINGNCPANRAPQYMGYAANASVKGKFYLQTNSREPYATNSRRPFSSEKDALVTRKSNKTIADASKLKRKSK